MQKKTNAQIKVEAAILPTRRKGENLPGGLYIFEDELEAQSIFTANVITCAGWLLELVKLKTGEIYFQTGENKVRPSAKQFGIFYPPFTITRPCFKNPKCLLKGIAGTGQLKEGVPNKPVVFETNFCALPKSIEQITEIFSSGSNFQSAEAYPKASLISLRAKQLIDENYNVYPSIARIAKRLKVSHEHLTRQFKRDFEMSPNAYLHQLRIADATFRLMQGEKIINVSNEVGYNDLSRFYKQFRKSTANSPGDCQSAFKRRID